MRTVRGALGLALLAALPGCADAAPSAPPGTVVVRELGLQFPAPDEALDVVYALGQAPEGQPAAWFSSVELAAVGGDACAAGATGAVSPYPLGRLVLAQESPQEVALETAVNPAESLGEALAQVPTGWLYYAPPPQEPCRPEVAAAAALQAAQTAAVREALRWATAVPLG